MLKTHFFFLLAWEKELPLNKIIVLLCLLWEQFIQFFLRQIHRWLLNNFLLIDLLLYFLDSYVWLQMSVAFDNNEFHRTKFSLTSNAQSSIKYFLLLILNNPCNLNIYHNIYIWRKSEHHKCLDILTLLGW